MSESKLLIIGDLLVDVFREVEVRKISPEAPVPVASLTGRIHSNPGGAGLAATYAAVNKIPHLFISVYGKNGSDLLRSNGVSYLPGNGTWCDLNIEKLRYIDVATKYHVLRVDNDDMLPRYLSYCLDRSDFFLTLEEQIKKNDISGVVMLDYNKGIFDDSDFCQDIIELCKDRVTTYVDSRSSNLCKFKGVDYLKLNDSEARAACANFVCNDIYQLKDIFGGSCIIVSHGESGASLYSDECESISPDLNKYSGKPDVTGCGDVLDILFMSNLCLKNQNMALSLKNAVDGATEFAYKDVNKRLCR